MTKEQRIAVKTMRLRRYAQRHARQPRFALQPGEIQQPRAFAKARIRLLQGNDIGIKLADHMGRSRRVKTPVAANAFMDIVGRHDQIGRVMGRVWRGGDAPPMPFPQGRENAPWQTVHPAVRHRRPRLLAFFSLSYPVKRFFCVTNMAIQATKDAR